jgi:hypothetical protein
MAQPDWLCYPNLEIESSLRMTEAGFLFSGCLSMRERDAEKGTSGPALATRG